MNKNLEHGKDDFRNQASVKTQSNGVTIRSTAIGVDGDKLNGKVEVLHGHRDYGSCNMELNTAGKFKALARLTKISPGFVLTPELSFANGGFGLKTTAEYCQPILACTAEYDTKKKAVNTTVAYGDDGISVGAGVTTDFGAAWNGKSIGEIVKPAVGVQYEDGNVVAAINYKTNDTTFSWYQRVSGDIQLATKVQATKEANILSIGGQYKLSPNTVMKSKATILNDGQYSLYTHVKHGMLHPNVILALSGTYNSDNTSAVGLHVHFGENK